ncbi:unnamed protein product [Sphagnum troendelagicum]
MGRPEPETLGDSDIMAIMGSFAFCCFFMPCVGASLEQALKNYYPATYLQSPHLQSCGSLQKKINVNHQTDFILVCVCGKGAKISKDDTDAESPTKFRQITKGLRKEQED